MPIENTIDEEYGDYGDWTRNNLFIELIADDEDILV